MIEFVLENRVDLQRLASVLIALAMWRWGGTPERIVASIFVGLFTLPMLVLDFFTAGSIIFSERGYLIVGIDISASILFVAVALNANRNYPLWVAGFQVVALAAHLVRSLVDAVSPLAYAILVIGPSYFQLILMLAGLIFHIRRTKKYGEYRDWRIGVKMPFGSGPPPDALKGQL